MSHYTWKNSHNIGFREIDEQRKILFKLIEKLYQGL